MVHSFDPTVTYRGDDRTIYFGRGFWHPFDGWEILLVVEQVRP